LRAVVVANVIGNAFIALSVVVALWSLWWIIRGSLTNVAERTAEDDARQRIAEGGAWDDGVVPEPFSDAELARLSDALAPSDLDAAGVEARPRPAGSRRRRSSNKRP
jgi:hypothetical protein